MISTKLLAGRPLVHVYGDAYFALPTASVTANGTYFLLTGTEGHVLIDGGGS